MSVEQKLIEISQTLPEDQAKLLLKVLEVVKISKDYVEGGHGSYKLMHAVMQVYSADTIDLTRWCR